MIRILPIAILGLLSAHPIYAESADALRVAAKNALIVERDYPKAIKLFQASLDAGLEKEQQEECLNYLAESYWANNEVDNAIWTFDKEIRSGNIDEYRSSALFRKAMAHMAKGEDELGMATYAQLAKEYPEGSRAPNAVMVQANYAVLEEANLRKGIRLYEQIALKYPESDEARTALQWLPNLRKMTTQDLREQLKAESEKRKLAEKMEKKNAD